MMSATAQAPHALRLPLRPYQQEALQAIVDARTHGVTRPLVVLPVGAGKTVVFAHLLRQRAGRALVLAHRDELLQQAVAKLRLVDPTVQIGMVKADDNAVDAPVVVASVQTLSRPQRLVQLRPGFATLVVDEAHHATAPTYRRILRHCGAFAANGPLTLGVTATPERSDTARLSEIWQEVVYEQSLWSIEVLISNKVHVPKPGSTPLVARFVPSEAADEREERAHQCSRLSCAQERSPSFGLVRPMKEPAGCGKAHQISLHSIEKSGAAS